jgi:hypothetical protein
VKRRKKEYRRCRIIITIITTRVKVLMRLTMELLAMELLAMERLAMELLTIPLVRG